jgi:tetratricopeptide (TPR) repeat protein
VQAGRDVTVLVNSALYAAPAPHRALHQLPPPPADRPGRAAARDELAAAIAGGARTLALWGLGGTGKTALALALAARVAADFPDAQLFLDLQGTADTPTAPAAAMAQVLRAFDREAPIPEDEAELAGAYRSLLHGRRVLLLLDNAADARQVAALLPPGDCLALITARARFYLPGLVDHHLEALPAAEAQTLLLRIAPRAGGAAAEMAALCGGLPLALRICAATLAERADLEPADYLQRLRRDSTRLGLVDTVLAASHALLPEALATRWCALGIFPAAFDGAAAAAVWAVDGADEDAVLAAGDDLSELARRGLLEWDAASARYRLHDLVRVYVQARLSAETRETLARRHAGHYVHVLAAAERTFSDPAAGALAGLARYDGDAANIAAGQAWTVARAGVGEHADRLGAGYALAGAECLALRLHPREHLAWLSQGLAAARRLGNRPVEGACLDQLGNVCAALGDLEGAVECHRQSVAIAREVDDPGAEGAGLSNLGNALSALGRLDEALVCQRRAVELAREAGDRAAEGLRLGTLGATYLELEDVAAAADCFEQALPLVRESGDRVSESTTLGNLANARESLGEHAAAVPLYEEALAIARELGDRRDEGVYLGDLGNAHYRLGDLDAAVAAYEGALDIARETGNLRGEGIVLGNLGNAHDDRGELEPAVERYAQALEIARRTGNRLAEGHTLYNLALICRRQGDLAYARRHAGAALALFRELGRAAEAEQAERLLGEMGE